MDLALKAAAAVSEVDAVRYLRKLVQIRSVYEPGRSNEQQAALCVAELLRDIGLEPVIQEVIAGRPNVIADWCGTSFDAVRDRTLMFEGHTDVVTEGDVSAWTYPPFGAEIVGDRLYGRGSADMKGGIVAALMALAAVKQVAPDLPGRIRLGIVADEEGMMLGIKHFIEQGWAEDVSAAIICEPEENELCLFQKGALRVRLFFKGVMAHGAMPYAGVNPIAALSSFMEQLKAYESAEQERLGSHEFLGLPWFTPTIVQAPVSGEAQLNVMPAEALLTLDIRTIPGQDHDEIMQSLQRMAQDIQDQTARLQIELECLESRPWTETPADDPLVAALEQAYPLVFKTAPRFGGVPGATDGTFLRAWANVPIVTVGPGDRLIPHQCDEYVELSEVVKAARLYAAAAVLYLSK